MITSSLLLSIWIAIVVIPQLSTSYTKTCGWYGCDATTITCPSNEDCEIQCTSNNACANSIITCPAHQQCTIHCQDTAACYGITVYAQHSSKLQLTGCQSTIFSGDYNDYTCSDMTLYCPPNINGNKKCIIAGDKSLGGQHSPYMQFYAINGWKDIDFSGYSGSRSTRKGTMHCTADYSKSCAIDNGLFTGYWTCDDRNNICMDPPTPSPTSAPTTTISPTNAPTNLPTKTPTNFPTKIPTNFPTQTPTNFPSNIPTTTPTKMPTTSPSNLPTITPTKIPTIFPTISPSIRPSISPTASPINNVSGDTKLSVLDDNDNSDSLEVHDATTTTKVFIEEAIDVTTTHHHKSMVQEYIIWFAIGFGLIVFNCGIFIYCRSKRKTKPKIYHTQHYDNNNNKDIEMQQPKTGDIVIDGDGMETIIPPKKGKIKYSPLGAQNLSIKHEVVPSQSYPTGIDTVPPSIPAPISIAGSHSVIPSTVSSINNLNTFILDAQNDTEVLEENDMVITPCFDEDIMTTKGYDIEDEQEVDMVVTANNDDETDQDDEDMVHNVNNDVMINGDDIIITTKGNDEDNDMDELKEDTMDIGMDNDVEVEEEDETIIGIEY